MPERKVPLQWDAISDFSPGIYSQSNLSVTGAGLPATKGYAQQNNTFRCIALPNGGLAPLPKLQQVVSSSPVSASPTTPYWIVGFHATGPVLTTGTPSGYIDELHFAVEYGIAGPTRNFNWFRNRLFESGGANDSVVTLSTAVANTPGTFHGVTFVESRMSHTAPYTDIGSPVVGASWRNIDTGAQFVWAFPDPSAAGANAPLQLSNAQSGYLMAHEGRLVLATFVPSQPHGVNANLSYNEAINYSDPSNSNQWPVQNSIYAPESPAGYGVGASVNTSELLLIKNKGGAVLVSGDLDSVTVTRLPFVQSTGNLFSLPAVCPQGLYYLVLDQGLWLWSGGNSSAKVSQALDDNFYDLAPPFLNPTACAEMWGGWVMISNNWIYDGQSFWRLEDPAVETFLWFSRSFRAKGCYAAPASFATSTSPIAWYFDRNVLVSNYSWQSHPLSWSTDRRVRVREVVVRALNPGTVTITFSGTGPDAGDTASYPITIPAGSTPQKVLKRCSYSGEDISVRIQSDGGAGVAPTVFEVQFGYEEVAYLNAT